MKPPIIRQEIILVTSSGHLKREYCENKDEAACHSSLSPAEQLEKACWDGLLPDLLPGMSVKNSFIWEIVTAENFISVSLGPYPEPVDDETTVDPFSLSQHAMLN